MSYERNGLIMDSKRKLLRTFPELDGMDDKLLDRLGTVADVLELRPGQHLVTAGQRASHCVVLVEGRVRPGASQALIGYRNLKSQAAWHQVPSTIYAETDVTVLVFDRRYALDLARQFEAIADTVPARSMWSPATVRPRLA